MTATAVPSLLAALLTGVTGNGAGPTVFWNGGPGLFTVGGTLGGGNVTLNYCVDGSNWVAAGAATTAISASTTPPNGVAYLPRCAVQAVVAGSTGTIAPTAEFLPINEGGA